MIDQWAFTSPFEGVVPHLYLDSRGNPTAGVGFLVSDSLSLRQLPWKPNAEAAVADYALLAKAPVGHVASFYGQFCQARLDNVGMRAVFQTKVVELQRAMSGLWRVTLLPQTVQLALTDMAYNLGAQGLAKFGKLQAAVGARDWAAAANECHRVGVQQARNDATRNAFLAALPVA